MSSIDFTYKSTVIPFDWCNDVNSAVYKAASQLPGAVVARLAVDKFADFANVKDYGAVGDGVVDDTAAINNALSAMGAIGGTVYFPAGDFKTTAFLDAENFRGLTIIGSTGQFGFAGTRIIGSHTGKTILSLVGSLYCHVQGITLEGDTAARPKTGLLLGRSSAASSGGHILYGINVQGYYQQIGTAIIASEENTWINCQLVTSAAHACSLLVSPTDGAVLNGVVVTIGGLTASSMEQNVFIGCTVANSDTTAGTTSVFMDLSAATGHIHFYGCFFAKQEGDSFVYLRLGAVDGAGTEFPIGFHDCCGETGGGTGPLYGMHIFSALSGMILGGLTLTNYRMQTPTSHNIYCDGAGLGSELIGPYISTPYRDVAGRTPSVFNRVDGGTLLLLTEDTTTFTWLAGSFVRYLGAAPTITTDIGNFTQKQDGMASSMPGELRGSAVFDPPDLAGGATQQTAVTVTGAVVGDYVVGVSFGEANAGILWFGQVTAADTVTVTQWNRTGGAINLGSETLRVLVRKQV